MKRRVIKQGHNTLTVTLPSEWAKKFNLSAGSEVDLSERDNGLFITTEKVGSGKKAEFNIDGLDVPTIWKYFMGVYREGYDELLVKFASDTKLESPYQYFAHHRVDQKYGKVREKKTALEFFHELATRFVGFEIIEHGKDYVIFKELSEATSKEFDNSLRRVFLLVQQMAEETCESLRTNNPKMLSHIHDVDINLDKFHDYCIRILNKLGSKESRKTSLLFSTLYLLELMGDEYKNISHHLNFDFKGQNYKVILEVAESVRTQIDAFYSLFYKFDKKKVMEISEIDKNRYFDITAMYRKEKSKAEEEIYHHLRIITRFVNALTELRIEMEF